MDIIPIPLNDQQIPLSTIRICTYFIVSARLDEGLLQTSLDGLIRHHWRKLGARVVKGASGWLEYHLPKKFDDNYALFNWSSTQNGALMADAAPILRKITKPSTESVGFLPGLSEVESVLRPGHWPLNRDDEPRDSPLFYVHLSKFADTTVVGLNFPHLFADQLGLSTIMKAWLGLAAGQTPPPMVGYDEDVLPQREFSSFSRPEIQRTGMMRVRWPMEYYVVILGLILELVFNPKEMRHTIFLPRWLVDKVHEQSSKVSEEEPGMEHKLTRGDIITAIMIKFTYMGNKASKMVTLSQLVNLRDRVPSLSSPNNCAGFVHNGLVIGTARFRHDPSTTITEIAVRNRKAVVKALEPEEIEKSLCVIREMTKRGQNLHVCEPLEKSYLVANWTGAWKELDFSAVAIGEGRARKTGAFVVGQGLQHNTPHRYNCTIMHSNNEGYWVDFSAPVDVMKAVKEYAKANPALEILSDARCENEVDSTC